MRIGIVNDVPLACEVLRRVVQSQPGLSVAWVARDGVEAVAAVERDRPDLVLMDLYMPNMDGVEATRRITAESKCPILVVTGTVRGHIDKVYEAMGCGAADAVDTPVLGPNGDLTGGAALLAKITTMGKLIGKPLAPSSSGFELPAVERGPVLVAIGVSTGGPAALKEVLAGLSPDPKRRVVVVQHIDPAFAHGLVDWLAEAAKVPLSIAKAGEPPQGGRVYLADTKEHLVLDAHARFKYTPELGSVIVPSVDVFFRSAAKNWPGPGVGVVLTGMLTDGADGLLKLRKRGWHTIAQDEATSVVWSMPKAAIELGAAVEVLPVQQIASAISRRCEELGKATS